MTYFTYLKENKTLITYLRQSTSSIKIKSTIEEKNNQNSFPDSSAIVDDSSKKYDTTIYRKTIKTSLYLLFESSQCRKYNLSLVGTLTIRILLICSAEKYSHTKLQQLRYYTITVIRTIFPLEKILCVNVRLRSNWTRKRPVLYCNPDP